MPRYTVLNTATEQQSDHRTWHAAMAAALKHPDGRAVIVEKDSDGERTYNLNGQIIEYDGYPVRGGR